MNYQLLSRLGKFFSINGILSIVVYSLLLAGFFTGCRQKQENLPFLEVNFITNIDNQPVFSWKMNSFSEGFMPEAARLIIADNLNEISKGEGNVFDSGKTTELNSLQTKYSGKLIAGNQYFARVMTWDEGDNPSAWSDAVHFFAPLNYPEDWESEWITYDYHPDSALPVFTHVFDVDKRNSIEFVRFYIAAPGFYEAYLNGEKIGDNVLDPGQTNYEDYAFYTAYTIDKDKLKETNTLAVMAGNGWYNQNEVWKGQSEYAPMVYGQPVFTCQMEIRYNNADVKRIISDTSWKWTYGPITYSNIYGGETYDANREVKMDALTYDGSPWKNSESAAIHPEELFEQYADPIRKMGEVEVARIIDNNDGKYIFDMGINFAGWVKLSINGEKGREITIRFAEELDSSLNLDPATTGVRATTVVQTSKYICKGDGTETWEPRFTYHGFRYAEVSGLKEKPSKDLLTGVIVYSSVPDIGDFSSSEENINKLHELANRTITSNIHSIPTDCPHRERCGWTGDAHALAKSLFYNFDAQLFMTKYAFDMRSSAREEKVELYFGESFHDRSMKTKPVGIPTMIVPGKRTSGIASPDWGTALVQIPWYLYLFYGDNQILEEFYSDMQTWVDYIHAKNQEGIIPHGLGDWCPPYSWDDRCPVPLSSTAFHILDVRIMKQASEILGYSDDYDLYSKMLDLLVDSFNREFLDVENGTYGTQTANAMALEIGIVPDNLKKDVARAIVNESFDEYKGFLNTGIFGIGRVFYALSENGFEDEAFRLLTKKGPDSFAYMWDHWNATTLWETLPVTDPESDRIRSAYFYSSHSHPMQAGYEEWFYSGLAGINPVAEAPGFRKILFKPYLTKHLESATASYSSGFGEIVSSWKNEGRKLLWNISIPAGSEGEIMIPNYKEEVNVEINGKDVVIEDFTGDFTSIGIYKPGNYLISVSR